MIKKILSVAVPVAFLAGLQMAAAESGGSVTAGDGHQGGCSACWETH